MNIQKQFLVDTDHTGRFIVRSDRTGRTYFIEPTGNVKTRWGDVQSIALGVQGSYGEKYRGSVDKQDSLITEENGFKNITMLDPGISPLKYIEKIDSEYESIG